MSRTMTSPADAVMALGEMRTYQTKYRGTIMGLACGRAADAIEAQQAELDALRRASAPAERVPTYCWNGLGFGPDMSK